MLRASMRRSLTLGFALFALIGCQPKIGDECERSTDCSIRGDRVCDLSHRVNSQGVVTPSGKGECSIDGCGRGSCPDEAACIKVYGSNFLSIACDPEREDLAIFCDLRDYDDEDGGAADRLVRAEAACMARGCLPASGGSCDLGAADGGGADDPCLWTCPARNDCDTNEVCLPEGLCADEITARTSCRRKCKRQRDCRSGYECRATGSEGVYRAPNIDDPDDPSNIRVCMPVI